MSTSPGARSAASRSTWPSCRPCSAVDRAALIGISLFVDPLGRVEARTEVRADAVLVRPINLGPPGTTVSARCGEVEAAPAALMGVALLLLAQKTRPPGRTSR